jgi:hypothetical protein
LSYKVLGFLSAAGMMEDLIKYRSLQRKKKDPNLLEGRRESEGKAGRRDGTLKLSFKCELRNKYLGGATPISASQRKGRCGDWWVADDSFGPLSLGTRNMGVASTKYRHKVLYIHRGPNTKKKKKSFRRIGCPL